MNLDKKTIKKNIDCQHGIAAADKNVAQSRYKTMISPKIPHSNRTGLMLVKKAPSVFHTRLSLYAYS
ncbi:hypothetical protein [Photobacterium sp. TLY01]|uniref:hypothetical protein n=1 Tax=Photobacterium sp. TLY01 TaxID=2907534 RepID=UPI001F2E2B3B|nr:hypothetical protein [Photobacterium sp. TLY01]UIP29944.1 hypothetical protein LN341_20530 [Photobacterium sp. TLY01]